MCGNIIKSFTAFCYFGKNNLPGGKKHRYEMKVEQCKCGDYWTISFSGQRIKVEKSTEEEYDRADN